MSGADWSIPRGGSLERMGGTWDWLHRRAVYPLATRLRGESGVFAYLAEMQAAEALDAAAQRQRQDERLAQLLAWAAARSPHYRERIPGPVPGQDARARLAQLPLLEKRTVQEEPERLLCAPFEGRVATKSTGGSTGAPVRIAKDAEGVARERAASWLAAAWFGIAPGDRSVRFWGTPLTRRRRLQFALADLAMNRIRLSAFDLDPADLDRYWRRCRRFRPRWFYGYASLLHLFAEHVERRGWDGRSLGLRVVVPTAEPLSARQRADLVRVLGAAVQVEYGCGETGAIAYECPAGLLHEATETVLVELLDPAGREVGPGETGEVVVTDLGNRRMPLIRYRLGDRAVRGPAACPCGRATPTLERVWGRIHDVVFTPAGRRWHGEKIDYLMSQLWGELGGFRQYQVVQTGPATLEVRLVADAPPAPALEQRIRQYAAERLDGMEACVRRVDAVERAPNGKLRVVRNEWLSRSALEA